MNLLLLQTEDMLSEQRAQISGRRLTHMHSVHRVNVGDRLRCGLINGKLGTAQIISLSDQRAELELCLEQEPPPPLPVTLILALPRPKMLKRTLQTLTTLGVKRLILINAYRVEKSYWSTPILEPDNLHEHLLLGLEQAGDTLLPEVLIRKRFKPFVEDELGALIGDQRALIAHPYNAQPCPPPLWQETVLAIGPEGGFIPYEVELMQQQGMQAIHLGRRILRVETAVPALLSRLFPLP